MQTEPSHLYTALVDLPAEDILESLWDVAQTDFTAGFDLFTTRLSHGRHHHEAADVFKHYYDTREDSLENDLNTLSRLAAVFVNDPIYLGEYNKVCARIRRLVNARNTGSPQ